MFDNIEDAYQAFLSNRQNPRSAKESKLLSGGIPFETKVEDRRVVGHTFGEGKPVLLMHGWGGRGTQFLRYIDPLVERGYKVILPDAPGHGDSEGEWSTMFYFGRTVKKISELWDLHASVNHSISATATPWAISQGAKIPRLVLIAPTCEVKTFFEKFVERTGIDEAMSQLVFNRWVEEYGLDTLTNASVHHTIQFAPNKGLVVHDTDDTEASVEDGRRIHSLWNGSEYMETSGLGHLLILRNEAVVDRIVKFIDSK